MIGGSPLRILRLNDRGAALVRALLSPPAARSPSTTGSFVHSPPAGRHNDERTLAEAVAQGIESGLVDRLLDTGMAHPQPTVGPFSAADVTVVIPVRGHSDALARTLVALRSTAARVASVVVVDDRSADADSVRRITVAHGATLVRHDVNRGPAAARNTGLAGVATPLVAFVDAGCRPAAGWLDLLLPHFGDPDLAAVAPRIVSASAAGSGTAVDRYQQVRSSLDLGPRPAPVRPRTRVSYVPSACLVARVDALRSVGGFEEALRVGEDVDLEWRLAAGPDGCAAGGPRRIGEPPTTWRVRYEPRATVAHEHRTTLRTWFRRRIDYGTAAGPLAIRHPGALAPAGVSGWSATAWGLAAAGHPVAGTAVAAGTTALLVPRLGALPEPAREAVRLAGRGHLGAGRILASALTGPWWPVVAVAALRSRRARRVLLAAALVPALGEWWQRRPPLDPLRWVLLRLADDVGYGTGVWIGCAREHTVEPLVPTFRSWPGRASRASGRNRGRAEPPQEEDGPMTSPNYKPPGALMRTVGNRLMLLLSQFGVSLRGVHELRVRGRRSGEWRTVPVNPLHHEGRRYLVAPRGETEWVRNLRAAGAGELALGRRTEAFTAREVADADKGPILRAYLKRWKPETGALFGIEPDAPEAEFTRIAPDHPVFEVTRAD